MVTGTAPAAATAARMMLAEQRAAHRQGRAAALAGDLRDRAAEVHVDVVDAVLAPRGCARPRRGCAGRCRRAAPTGWPPSRRSGASRAVLALRSTRAARRDHLGHVQPGAEAGAEAAERRVGDAGHRGQHDGRVDRERADAERHAIHSSTIGVPTSASRRRSERQRQAEHGAVVAVDAVDERRRVAVDREAAGDPQRLVGGEVGVDLGVGRGAVAHERWTPRRWPVRRIAVSITQWPLWSTAVRPATDAHQARASSTDAGLPRVAPSTSSTESQPTTRASLPAPSRSATAVALRSASVRATSCGRPGDVVLGDAAHDHLGREPRGPQHAEAGGRRGGEDEATGHPTRVADPRRAGEPGPADSLRPWTDRRPTPRKLLADWMEWEKGETPPGKVISNLKTHGLRGPARDAEGGRRRRCLRLTPTRTTRPRKRSPTRSTATTRRCSPPARPPAEGMPGWPGAGRAVPAAHRARPAGPGRRPGHPAAAQRRAGRARAVGRPPGRAAPPHPRRRAGARWPRPARPCGPSASGCPGSTGRRPCWPRSTRWTASCTSSSPGAPGTCARTRAR